MSLTFYADADWGGDKTNRRSVYSHYLLLSGHPIVWSSKKQTVIFRSTIEAEYRAIANSICKIMWVVSLLSELGVKLSSILVLWSDNTGMMDASKKNYN